MMSKNSLIILSDLLVHVTVLLVFIHGDPYELVARKICERDGVGKLIRGLTTMVNNFRSLICSDSALGATTGMMISIVEHLATGHHSRVELAARGGILQLLVALDPNSGDLPDGIISACLYLLRSLPRFFVYYSVIEAFTEPMRFLTNGEHPPEGCILGGPLESAWSFFKRTFIQRYCTKRWFESDVKTIPRYCNNVSVNLTAFIVS